MVSRYGFIISSLFSIRFRSHSQPPHPRLALHAIAPIYSLRAYPRATHRFATLWACGIPLNSPLRGFVKCHLSCNSSPLRVRLVRPFEKRLQKADFNQTKGRFYESTTNHPANPNRRLRPHPEAHQKAEILLKNIYFLRLIYVNIM